jgi:hypothetical protein
MDSRFHGNDKGSGNNNNAYFLGLRSIICGFDSITYILSGRDCSITPPQVAGAKLSVCVEDCELRIEIWCLNYSHKRLFQ